MSVSTNAPTFTLVHDLSQIDLAHASHLCSVLSNHISTEEHLLSQSADDLLRQFQDQLSIMALDAEGQLAAHATLWKQELSSPTHPVYELGTTWVRPDLRGHGLNESLYKEFLERHKDKAIIATTTNPASLAVGKKVGLITLARKKLPMAIWQASCCCPATKMGTHLPTLCLLAAGERQCKQTERACYFRANRAFVQHYML